MSIEVKFISLFSQSSFNATSIVANALIKILMGSLTLIEAEDFYHIRDNEKALLDRAMEEINSSTGKSVGSLQQSERSNLIQSIDNALKEITQDITKVSPNEAKKRLDKLREMSIGLV